MTHDFRVTTATEFYETTKDPMQVIQLLAHKSLRTTETYIKARKQDMLSSMHKIQAIRSTSMVERPAVTEELEVEVQTKPIRKRLTKADSKQEGFVPPLAPPLLTKHQL